MVGACTPGESAPEDIEGSTFSISNLGMFNVDHFIAIIIDEAAVPGGGVGGGQVPGGRGGDENSPVSDCARIVEVDPVGRPSDGDEPKPAHSYRRLAKSTWRTDEVAVTGYQSGGYEIK